MATGKHSVPSKHAKKKEAANRRAEAPGAGVQHGPAPATPAYMSSRTAAPERPKRSRGRKVLIAVVVVIVVILVVAVASFAVFFGMRALDRDVTGQVAEGQQIVVEIPQGSSTRSIAELLVADGVIGSSREFVDAVDDAGVGNSLQAGTYEFTGGQDVGQIVDAIAHGQTAGLTIPEGYTLKQIAERVGEQTDIDEDEFYDLVKTGAADYVADYPFLKAAYKGSLEGFLFPATYELSSDMTADGLVRQMLDKFSEEMAGIDLTSAGKKNLDEYDVVTLASIIEKESRMSGDKADISAVFYNRLKADMPLGSDVTTYYAVGKDLTEELTQEDLDSDSPYNTRNPKHRGLPAGPICSPGIEALKAAAQPSQATYLYFFWSDSQGKTMFFDNLDDFNAAWKKYGA